jgi:hypothetical protein
MKRFHKDTRPELTRRPHFRNFIFCAIHRAATYVSQIDRPVFLLNLKHGI